MNTRISVNTCMGLRQRQKENRLRRILEAATDLFVKNGYAQTKAEDIADAAEVSIGTLYNYFDSKGDILLALATLETDLIYKNSAALATNPKGSASKALEALFFAYFDPKQLFLNEEVWRLSIAISYANPQTEHAISLRETDRLLCKQVVELLDNLKKAGKIAADTDCQMMGEILFNNMNMLYFEFSRSDKQDMDKLRRKIAKMTRAIAGMIAATPARSRAVA